MIELRKLVLIFTCLLLFSFDSSCKKKYEIAYKEGYSAYSKKEIDSLNKANERFGKAIRFAVMAMNGEYDANMALGLQYKKLKMYLEATKAFDRASKIMPKEIKPYYEMGNAYANYALLTLASKRQGFFNKAEESYEAALNIAPRDNAVHRSMGLYYGFIKKDVKKGIDHLKMALRDEDADFGGWLSLGTLYAQEGKFTDALECYNKVKEMTKEGNSFHEKAIANIEKVQTYIK